MRIFKTLAKLETQLTLTTTLDEREPGSPEPAAGGALGDRFLWPRRLTGDPRRWATVRRAADALGVLAAAAAVLIAGPAVARPDVVAAATFAACLLALLHSRRMFHKQFAVGSLDACARALASCAIGAMLAITAGTLAGSAHPDLTGLRLWLTTAAVLCGTRTVLGLVERRARARGLLMTPTLVVGAGVVGSWVVRRLERQPSLGLRPIGFLDAEPSAALIDPEVELSVLGTPAEAVEIARRTGARQLVFAFSWERDHRLAGVVRRCQEAGLEVAIVPRLYEAVNERATLDHVGGLPLMGFRPVRSDGWRFRVKYAIDRLSALLALIALAPLLIAIAVAVRLSSPGPVIYRQRRVGRGGRAFDLLKFRTMTAPARRPAFTPLTGMGPGGVEGADRRTPVGRWLRNTSLDELPQLLNVLHGEMSLVGPRPERPEFAAQFAAEVPGYDDRHRVKPGITGWAQVNGLRGQTSIADRVEWDNHYIENWSLELELRTLALTLAAVAAFREPSRANPAADTAEDSPPLTDLPASASPPLTDLPAPASPALTALPALVSPAPTALESPALRALPSPALRVLPSPAATASREPRLRQPAPGPALTLVEGAGSPETHWFCGYCGVPATAQPPPPTSRVCGHCGAGLLLEAPADAAPGREEPFLVVDGRLTVQAVSRHAEALLGAREPEVIDHPVTELITDADAEPDQHSAFVAALADVADSDQGCRSTFVRPRAAFGIRVRARISHCGPPRAALIVLETPTPGSGLRLRLVPATQQSRAAGQRA